MRSPSVPVLPSCLVFLLLASGAAAGCSGDGSSPGDGTGGTNAAAPVYCAPAESCPVNVDGVDLDSPKVSFEQDVIPIFQEHCNNSTCHGSAGRSRADLYLGPRTAVPTPVERTNIIADLTTRPSVLGPTGTLNVVKGDWSKSFLMLKVDGCQNDAGLACPGGTSANEDSVCKPATTCGDGMPQLDTTDVSDDEMPYPLAADDRTTLRRWIHQGALDN